MSALSTEHRTSVGAREWLTLVGRKKILAVVHTITYGKRLIEILSVLEDDFRLQVVFTAPPHVFGDDVPRFLQDLGAAFVPWDHAVHMVFDLALAAGPGGVERISAPLITVPHGAGYLKRISSGPEAGVAGLRPQDLTPGGVRPAAVVVPHHAELAELERHCPDILPVAHVVGDPIHDRIRVSLPRRDAYRRALGVPDGKKLVVVTSTWGRHSSFGLFESLLPRITGELDSRAFLPALLIHPNVWAGHGSWQVKAWLAHCTRLGIALVPPRADWRSVLISADLIIGDHGSVTLYGTLTNAPIVLASSPKTEINPASAAGALALTAPALSPAHPLAVQLRYATAEYRREEYASIASRITSEPGRFNRNMRRLVYRTLGMNEPAHSALTVPLPAPPALSAWASPEQGVSA